MYITKNFLGINWQGFLVVQTTEQSKNKEKINKKKLEKA